MNTLCAVCASPCDEPGRGLCYACLSPNDTIQALLRQLAGSIKRQIAETDTLIAKAKRKVDYEHS